MVENAQRKSLEPKVFRVNDVVGKDTLVGSHCAKCDRNYFPPRQWCAACFEPGCTEIELSREGVLQSFALVQRRQAYCLVEPPYVLGEVSLPEGTLVYTTINLWSEITPGGVNLSGSVDEKILNSLQRGQKVKLDPVVIKRDEDGCDIVAFNFSVVEE